MVDSRKYPRGGHGGSAEIIGGTGVAQGGNGGRGGAPGYGVGGDGGGGSVFCGGNVSDCGVRGGDGGDAGRPARPALGGASPASYLDAELLSKPGMTDIYGIPQLGKGGDSYTAYVIHDGYIYCFNILLQLIRGPVPRVIEKSDIIDLIDELGFMLGVVTEQQWWNLAVEKFPEETFKIMAYMRAREANRVGNGNAAGLPDGG